MRMKFDINKGICPDFRRNILDGFRDHYELPMGDLAMNLPPHHLWELPCLKLFLICLELIIHLIEIACPSLLLPNLDSFLYKKSIPLETFT